MTYRELVRDMALDQHGFITTQDARELGVPPVELRKIAARGGLDAVAYGLYRIPDMAPTDTDQYAEAVLRVGKGAYLIADTVLAMHYLGFVNPPKIRVGTPHRVRSTLPGYIRVEHHPVPDADLTAYDGIPSTTIARALLDCRGIVMTGRLLDALQQAGREGLVTRRDAGRIRSILRRAATDHTA